MDDRIIDFSCNVNPLGPPPEILANVDLEKAVSSYPDHTNQSSIDSISAHFSLPQECVAVGGGSTEFFFTFPKAFDIGTGILVTPSFWEYEVSLKHAHQRIIYFPTYSDDGFHIDFAKLGELLSSGARRGLHHTVYLCQPNNPTSTLSDPQEVLSICEQFPTTRVIVDETYLLFRQDYEQLSLIREASQRANLIVVTSFSKFFTVPGLRMGMCCSTRDQIDAIRAHQIPYGVNSVAQALIPPLLESHEFIRESRKFMANEKTRVYGLAKENTHLRAFAPEANFMLISSQDAIEIVGYLRQQGLMVRDGTEFLGLGIQYLRFSIRNPPENNRLLHAIQEYYNRRRSPS